MRGFGLQAAGWIDPSAITEWNEVVNPYNFSSTVQVDSIFSLRCSPCEETPRMICKKWWLWKESLWQTKQKR